MTHLDIAVTTVEDALNAEQGGADSIELSIDLAADGLTPPLALVRQVRGAVQIRLHVIIRPHHRDFIYTPDEVELMLEATRKMTAAGVDGLVVGAHLRDGCFDVALVQQIAALAPGKIITVHRAIDSCANPGEALQQLSGSAHRILASGRAPDVQRGKETLRQWVQQFGGHFSFVAAGKVQLETARELADYTKVHEIHTASAVRTNGVVDVAKVRHLVELLKG